MPIATCRFCGCPSTLLCDGPVWAFPNGTRYRVPGESILPGAKRDGTCDVTVCRTCARKIMTYHVQGIVNGRRSCRWDTMDLCPLCQQVQDELIPSEVSS